MPRRNSSQNADPGGARIGLASGAGLLHLRAAVTKSRRMSLWRYSNPAEFMRLTTPALPVLWGLTAVLLAVGLGWGFFLTPDDYQQGATVKILFIHVPAALMAINAWLMMLVASLIWFIRRHHVSALAARAAAPVGATMTLIALLTGAIWGEPMWGTWWAWDPRLTSFFVLFLFYLGYMALWEAVDEPDKAADLTAIVCLVGSVFALLSRYAVFFWSQGLHQGPSLSLDARENMDDAFWLPLVISMAGFVLLFVSLVLVRTRTEIRLRRLRALEALEARA
jgi:heme exporter protein C